MGKKKCSLGTLCLLVCFVKTVTSLTVQAAKGQTTTTIPCSLAATLPAFQGPGDTIYTTDDDATINPSLPASLKARLAILDGDLVISNVESSDAGSYRCSYTGQGQDDNILEVGCEFLTAPSNGEADTLFGMPGDSVTFSCEDGYTLEGDTTLTCQANYIWNATEPVCKGGCSVWLCFIGLIVTVVLCSGKLGLYFCKILVFKRILSIEFGLKIATPSAAICLAGILLGTLLCFLASGCDDEKTWGTAVGVVLVICCPCCSVGIIIIHFKMKNEGNISTATVTGLQEQKNSGNDGGSSCFPRNNSILPICAGTDQQPQPSQGGQGQGGQHTAKGQTKLPPDHGRQKPDGDNGRPLPIPDKDDGLQKSKTKKSGSVVSKGDVEIDEAPQFPRKLPEIPPGGEKNIRGISANFDEVVPDKKRLTPIGKETIEKFDEESPRKKKKKKKDKGKDTSVEYNTDL